MKFTKYEIFIGIIIIILIIANLILTVLLKREMDKLNKVETEPLLVYYSGFESINALRDNEFRFINHYSKLYQNELSLQDSILILDTIKQNNQTVLTTHIILSIISIESHFFATAYNPVSRDYGIGQINHNTYLGFCKEEECDTEKLYDIEYNIKTMLKVMKDKEDRIIKKLHLKIDIPKDKAILTKALIMSYNSGTSGYFNNYHNETDSKYYKVIVNRMNNWEKIMSKELKR